MNGGGASLRNRCCLVATSAFLAVAGDAAGQSELEPAPKPPVVDDWTLQARVEATYDTNVFRLSDDSIDRLRADVPADRTSGRFDDMNTPQDVFLEAELALRRRFTDSEGDDFRLSPGIRLLEYFNNPRKTHPEFFLEMSQELQPATTLAFDTEYRKDVFVGNYFADAVDLVGSVSDDERRYEPGVYDQWSASMTLEQRLWRRSKESWEVWRTLGVRRVDLDAEVGAARRWYYAPFSNRDMERVSARVRLAAQVFTHWDASVEYRFDRDRTDHGFEPMIRDEDDFDVDFNGDGDRVDQDVRAVERVDRSRNQQTFGARLSWEFATDWSIGVRGTMRVQDYLSDEPFDSTYRDRLDRAHELRCDLKWAFFTGSEAYASAGWAREQSNRDAATTLEDQDVDYQYRFVGLGVRMRF